MMRYLFKAGKGAKRRVMHIAKYNSIGESIGTLCGNVDYDRSINAPFALGRPVCKKCKNIHSELE